MKRIFDILSSMFLLVVLIPVFIVVSIAVRLSMGAPIFFVQVRPGFRGGTFRMIKFRTMRESTDLAGNMLTDEARLCPFGNLLRSSSLDELPELWNVLKGDMSLVGPRPLLVEYLPLYSREQARRHAVRPGVTGWAQVNGRNAISWEKKFELDVWYVDNRSLWLDIKILWLTFIKVFSREGVSHDGHATMEKFRGSS